MLVAIDYETCDSRGASFEYFRKDFRIFSLSCAWYDDEGKLQQWFDTRTGKIKAKLQELADNQDQIVAHNLPYEQGCTKACFPSIKLNWYADTMRLSQLRDGGGEEFGAPSLTLEQEIARETGDLTDDEINKLYNKTKGLSLEACAARFLDAGLHSHKSNAHKYLEEHHGIKKNFGGNLHLLPYILLEEYNNLDTEVTLLLYAENTKYLKEQNFDWRRDNLLYLTRSELMSQAYIDGIKIDSESLLTYILEIEAEITELDIAFREQYKNEIRSARLLRYATFRQKFDLLKTDKGREKRWEKTMMGRYAEEYSFNLNSGDQLALLFKDVMKIEPKFSTKTGKPSFKSTHLGQWGDGGKMLIKRKKRMLVLNQCVNVYCAAMYDGRVHCSIKVAGTRTNRVAGGRSV